MGSFPGAVTDTAGDEDVCLIVQVYPCRQVENYTYTCTHTYSVVLGTSLLVLSFCVLQNVTLSTLM